MIPSLKKPLDIHDITFTTIDGVILVILWRRLARVEKNLVT